MFQGRGFRKNRRGGGGKMNKAKGYCTMGISTLRAICRI